MQESPGKIAFLILVYIYKALPEIYVGFCKFLRHSSIYVVSKNLTSQNNYCTTRKRLNTFSKKPEIENCKREEYNKKRLSSYGREA